MGHAADHTQPDGDRDARTWKDLRKRLDRTLGTLLSLAPKLDYDLPSAIWDKVKIPDVRRARELSRIHNFLQVKGVSFWVAGRFLNAFARQATNYLNYDLWDAAWHSKYMRAGQDYKPYLEARALWEQVPAAIRMRGPEAVRQFHQGKDWSHIYPRIMGGAATADNGVWWSAVRNRRLGGRPMSRYQIAQARTVLMAEGTRAALAQSLQPMLRGGAAGALSGLVLSVLEYGLQFAEGKISRKEMYSRVTQTALAAGAGAAALTGLITGMAIVFPVILPVLAAVSVPLAIASYLSLSMRLTTMGRGWWRYLRQRRAPADIFRDLVLPEGDAPNTEATGQEERAITKGGKKLWKSLKSVYPPRRTR